MFDAGLRGSAGAAIMPADQDDIGMPFRHTRGDSADADLGDELDADARVMVGIFEIVNQLRQIFDGIDVMMRGWRDEPHAGRRVAHFCDPWIDLAARQLAALPRLGALRHFDLQLLRLRQVITGDTKSSGCDLLDSAVARVAVGIKNVTRRILAALARVALAADPVHGDGECLVCFLADRAVGHSAGLKPLDNGIHGFHFVDRNRPLGILELHQSAQGRQLPRLNVDQLGVFLERLVVVVTAGLLQKVNRSRIK